jgi:hypothetical protein
LNYHPADFSPICTTTWHQLGLRVHPSCPTRPNGPCTDWHDLTPFDLFPEHRRSGVYYAMTHLSLTDHATNRLPPPSRTKLVSHGAFMV